MFVFTVKWNKRTAVLILIGVAVLLALLVLAFGNSSGSSDSGGIDSAEDAAGFLESLGWTVDPSSAGEKDVVIPMEFSAIYSEYNELQKAQGYDLSDYRGMEVTIYTYDILNYANYSGNVVADVYVRSGSVIGGDIHSLDLDGFMHGLRRCAE